MYCFKCRFHLNRFGPRAAERGAIAVMYKDSVPLAKIWVGGTIAAEDATVVTPRLLHAMNTPWINW